MSHLRVLHDPEPTLRAPSKDVAVSDIGSPRLQTLIEDMVETMKLENGVGIAAPQVGTNERVIIVEGGRGPEAFFNPRIVGKSFGKVDSEEGCLSVPGVFGIVKRHKKVKVEAYDKTATKRVMDVHGFPAIIFQHEIDHLDGVLFVDKVVKYTQPPKL